MTDSVPALDMTLDELREALAPLLPGEAAFDGWSGEALAAAARSLGIPADRARLAFPGGAIDMIDAWFAEIDRRMIAAVPAEAIAAMPVRERIGALVRARLAAVAPDREALRRALNVLANPLHVPTAAKLSWRSADVMWRHAGDQATGFAHYSKRATLAALYGATILAFLDDASDGCADTHAFLDRRIGDVMRFEKVKARLKPDPNRHFSATRFLGRLRYPAR